MIGIRTSQSVSDLVGIKTLLSENHASNLSKKEQSSEGFVTINYSLDDLKALHEIAPSIIAVDDNKVVGYALAATRDSIGIDQMLDDLIQFVDNTSYRSIRLGKSSYIVVGQLCVSKSHRRQKIAQKIYKGFQQTYSNDYNYCITSVDSKNRGSLKAHLLRGFTEMQTTRYKSNTYSVVLWDWTESNETDGLIEDLNSKLYRSSK